MMRRILLVAMVVLHAGCGGLSGKRQAPAAREYAPEYVKFEYALDGKYYIHHEYLYGPGVESCRYAGERAESYMDGGQLMHPYVSSRMKDIYEKDGHIYQGTAGMDNEVLGIPSISKLTGSYNEKTKKWEGGMPYRSFEPLCSDRVAGYSYYVGLRKSSALSIEGDIEFSKRLLDGPWKGVSNWESAYQVKRGDNNWLVFKRWLRANYLGDASEDWFLSVGDGAYYYKVLFNYLSSELTQNPGQYAIARGAFEHILDSFKIEKINPSSEGAAR